MHRTVQSHPGHLSDAARVVAVGLVDLSLHPQRTWARVQRSGLNDEVKLSLNLRRVDFPAKHFLRQNEIWCPETLCELAVN
jgi:hypothetical protein